jgi:hypothetical protein
MKMRTYIAYDGDTLRDVAIRYNIAVDELLALNTRISDLDSIITSVQTRLPSPLRSSVTGPASKNKSTRPSDPNEQWSPLTSLVEMEQKEYDVLIVGTGAGGGAVLWRPLAQQLRNSSNG